jgi:hypothetical protein
MNPDELWGVEAQLLRQCEYDLRALIYVMGAPRGAPRPRPIELPSEREDSDRVAREMEEARAEVDRVLGMTGEGAPE